MRVEWTEPALAQWEQSLDYIEVENAAAAQRIEARVVEAIEMLGILMPAASGALPERGSLPFLGHPFRSFTK